MSEDAWHTCKQRVIGDVPEGQEQYEHILSRITTICRTIDHYLELAATWSSTSAFTELGRS